MPDQLPFLLPIIFGVSLVLALTIHWTSGRMMTKGRGINPAKTEPYSCGEDLPVEDLRIDLERFLIFAVYFLIFDILAFVLATSFFSIGLVPIAYAVVVLMAVGMLAFSRRHV